MPWSVQSYPARVILMRTANRIKSKFLHTLFHNNGRVLFGCTQNGLLNNNLSPLRSERETLLPFWLNTREDGKIPLCRCLNNVALAEQDTPNTWSITVYDIYSWGPKRVILPFVLGPKLARIHIWHFHEQTWRTLAQDQVRVRQSLNRACKVSRGLSHTLTVMWASGSAVASH